MSFFDVINADKNKIYLIVKYLYIIIFMTSNKYLNDYNF